jgi:molybdate transport system regulatory protein
MREMAKADGHRLNIRIDLRSGARIGPGKVALLEAIEQSGSISGAGRLLKMSYKRAWDLTEELNRSFAEPLVATAAGGAKGGGTRLTDQGRALVDHYRAIEQAALDAATPRLRALGEMTPPEG